MGKLLPAAVFAFAASCILIALKAQNPAPAVEEYPAPLVRERQSVVIGNATETWELRWKAPPAPVCDASEADASLTCPCTGFAYGEDGDLTLVRLRNGEEIDRLALSALFKDNDAVPESGAILQRWEPDYEKDFAASEKDDFRDVVARRPVVKIMNFIDYDHDGNRSEFYLKTDTAPCGKSKGVVVGISELDPKLHVFTVISKPAEPLVLQKEMWEALSRALQPVEVVQWQCEDHGSDEETTVRLHSAGGEIDGIRRSFACPRYPDQAPVREGPL